MPSQTFCEPEITNKYHNDCLQVRSVTPQSKSSVKLPAACVQKTSRASQGGQKPSPDNVPPAYRGKETYSYTDGDGLHVILVPSKEPNYYPITLSLEEMQRLQEEAIVLDDKAKLKLMEEAKKEKVRLEEESAARKKFLQQFAQKGGPGMPPRLSALEREARDKANYLLKRAWELKKEDEDEVKLANSLILQTKCQAIRDAQIIEHKIIRKEMKEEEKRIEQMMEDERTRAYMMEKQKMEEERAQKERYVMELNQQVEEIEARRLLDAEMLVEERKKTNEAMFQLMMDELKDLQAKDEQKRKMMQELREANDQLRRTKEFEKEEDRIADLRMQEYMRMRAEREAKLEEEKQEEKKRKEADIGRIRAMQQAATDLQALQDEMAAVRRQEEYEREWRRKEREEARKRQRMEEDTRLGREQQVRDLHRIQAMELARDKREFERNLEVQLELQEKERLLDVKKKHDAENYRLEILKQINEKERERIEERQEKYAEGIAIRAELAKRKSELRSVVERKVETLKQNRVPQGYITEIYRRLQL